MNTSLSLAKRKAAVVAGGLNITHLHCARFWLVLLELRDQKSKLLLLHVFWHWDSSRLRWHCESCQGFRD